mmetsp:Transcript_62285/g.112211  ORF Transcript_62285/g.112211 Transcript_62285/m.112211 type:complete len:115 (-) Transcript_62285:33-377(-)
MALPNTKANKSSGTIEKVAAPPRSPAGVCRCGLLDLAGAELLLPLCSWHKYWPLLRQLEPIPLLRTAPAVLGRANNPTVGPCTARVGGMASRTPLAGLASKLKLSVAHRGSSGM